MKYLIGMLMAMFVAIGCYILNEYVLKFVIPDFLIGWMSCTIYMFTIDICEEIFNRINQ